MAVKRGGKLGGAEKSGSDRYEMLKVVLESKLRRGEYNGIGARGRQRKCAGVKKFFVLNNLIFMSERRVEDRED